MTDVQALERYAASGDPDAFRHLVTCYQRLVYAACARRLREPSDIEDAVQETFLRLAQHAGRIKTSVSGWLYTAATRVCLDRIRRDATRRRHELAWRPEEHDEHAAHYSELLRSVDDALAELPEKQRDVLVQYFLDGKTQTALAEEEGVTQSAIARRVERAVVKLREVLKQRGVAAPAAALGSFFVADAASAQVPGALTASLTKLGLSGAGAGAAGAIGTTATSAAATTAGASLAVKGLVGGGVIAAAAAVYVAVTPEEPGNKTASSTALIANTAPGSTLGELERYWRGFVVADPGIRFTVKFEGEQVRFVQINPEMSFTGTVVHHDPDANPPELDVRVDQTENPAMKGWTYEAVYEIDSDDGRLLLAVRETGDDRPRPDRVEPDPENGVVLHEATACPLLAQQTPLPGGVDHGIPLVPVRVDARLALQHTQHLAPGDAATAIPAAIEGLMMTAEDARLALTAAPEVRFPEPPDSAAPTFDPTQEWPVTVLVPVEWEDEVPAPYRVADSAAFEGVEYLYTGRYEKLDAAWTRLYEQALHDGYRPTGQHRHLTTRWVGPDSEWNQFALQVSVENPALQH